MEQTAQRKGGNQPPISAHPAFPAIVAMWFAALFGIGSLVLPVLLIEKMAFAIGMTPPVGFTTRLAIAAAMAVLGVGLGLFIARKVVASQGGTGGRRTAEGKGAREGTKRPIVATEELGEEGLGPVVDENLDEDDGGDAWKNHAPQAPSKPPLPGRRRALSVTDENGRSDYLASVPLPGEQDPYGEMPAPEDYAADPLELNDAVMEEVAAHEAEHAEAMDGLRNPARPETPAVEDEMHNPETGAQPAPMFQPAAPQEAGGSERLFDAPLAMPADGQAFSSVPPATNADTGATQGYSFAPVAAEAETDDPFTTPVADTSSTPGEPRQMFGAPLETMVATAGAPAFAAPTNPEAGRAFAPPMPAQSMASSAAAALNELSMSDLIARFSASLQRRNAHQAVQIPPAAALEATQDEEPAEGRDSATGQREPLAYNPFASVASSEPAPAPFAAPQGAPAPSAVSEVPFAPPQEVSHEAFAQEDAAAAPFAAPVSAGVAEPAPTQEFSQPPGNAMPAALRPLDLSAFEEEDEEDDPFTSGFGLQSSGSHDRRCFAAPQSTQQQGGAPLFAPPVEQPGAAPVPFAAPAMADNEEEVDVAEATETGNEGAYSSLLSMKSPLGSHHEFVRIEDDEDEADGLSTEPALTEPVVVFPGQNGQGSPAPSPASDGYRPFDAPPREQGQQRPLARAVPTTPAQKPADPAETERALREALEKLQRMSGAA